MVKFQRGRVPWNKGRAMPLEERLNISQKLKGRLSGDKHPMWGKKHTAESRKKMSESHLGKKCSPESYRKMFEKRQSYGWYKDREKSRMLMSKGRFGKARGKNNYRWKGGVCSSYPYYGLSTIIREKVVNMNCGLCVLCFRASKEVGSGAKGLFCHHKDGDKDNHSLNNLIPVCVSCHKIIHGDEEFWNGTSYLEINKGVVTNGPHGKG